MLFPPARRTLGGQTLCFDNYPHCPGVWGSTASGFLRALCAVACPGLVGWQVHSFHAIASSFAF